MKLYGFSGACSLVPHTALILSKADYDLKLLTHEEAKSPEYLAKNPQGAVPLLEDGEFLLSQNIAILDYINTKYPEAKLFGNGDAKQIAKAKQWLSYANADVHKAFLPLFRPSAFIDDASLEAKIIDSARKRLVNIYKIADDELAGKDYLTEGLTVADVYLYVTLRWAKGMELDLTQYNNLQRFAQKVQEHPAVQQALKEESLEPLAN